MGSKKVKSKVEKVKRAKSSDEVIGYDNLNGDPVFKKEETNVKAEKEKKEKLILETVMPEGKVAEKLEPLQPGQKYFEAPDGTLIIGEADRQQVWYRKLNDGKGGWINPKR